jgi:hypothetical protein
VGANLDHSTPLSPPRVPVLSRLSARTFVMEHSPNQAPSATSRRNCSLPTMPRRLNVGRLMEWPMCTSSSQRKCKGGPRAASSSPDGHHGFGLGFKHMNILKNGLSPYSNDHIYYHCTTPFQSTQKWPAMSPNVLARTTAWYTSRELPQAPRNKAPAQSQFHSPCP